MQFLTLLAAALATFATVAVAAPGQPDTKSDCDKCGDYGHDGNDHGHPDGGDHGHDGNDHGHPDGGDHSHDGDKWGHGGDDHKWGEKVRVGFSLDLNPGTPIGSLSCSATFAKKFPRKSPHVSEQLDGLLTAIVAFAEFHTLGDLPTAPFYGEVPGAGT